MDEALRIVAYAFAAALLIGVSGWAFPSCVDGAGCNDPRPCADSVRIIDMPKERGYDPEETCAVGAEASWEDKVGENEEPLVIITCKCRE